MTPTKKDEGTLEQGQEVKVLYAKGAVIIANVRAQAIAEFVAEIKELCYRQHQNDESYDFLHGIRDIAKRLKGGK